MQKNVARGYSLSIMNTSFFICSNSLTHFSGPLRNNFELPSIHTDFTLIFFSDVHKTSADQGGTAGFPFLLLNLLQNPFSEYIFWSFYSS